MRASDEGAPPLAEALGQLLMVGFPGPAITAELRALIEREHVGGVILFARNVVDAGQLLRLTTELQAMARAAGHARPLLIAMDQENGVVRRLEAGATAFPGSMALAAAGDEALAEALALASGRELRALGVNFNLAPVLDVNTNPANPVIGVRAFSDDAATVARLGVAVARGYAAAGLIACLKHFPGHGDTAVDSHRAVPTLAHDRARLEAVELAPFVAGITAGAPAVMVGHIVAPALGATLPASIAPEVVRELLRARLGFAGAVMTDCLEMDAIAETVGTERGAALAVRAGNDLALVSHRHDRQAGALAALREALASGTLGPEVARAALARVAALKDRFLTWEAPPTDVPSWVGGAAQQALAARAYAASTTLVRDDAAALPLRLPPEARLLVIEPDGAASTAAEDARAPRHWLADACRRRYPTVSARALAIRPSAAARDELRRAAGEADVVLLATKNARTYPEQAAAVQAVREVAPRLIAVAAHNPYDLLAYPEVGTYLATYEHTAPAMEALAAVLWGERAPVGRLPVALPGLYPRGHRAALTAAAWRRQS
ncbi:MAG TPA: beta-N-acetylhexosaminidase [Ktedonobacterales bacterium]|jgi:beta-N-acetylhexosaminidase